MKNIKSQLLGMILLLGAPIIMDAQGVSAPFEPIVISGNADDIVIETTANNELTKHIATNLEYPEYIREFGMQGTSLVRFRLDETGKIISKNIITSMGAAFDNAIMNSVKDLKSVSPIYKNGVATAYAIVVPVRFER